MQCGIPVIKRMVFVQCSIPMCKWRASVHCGISVVKIPKISMQCDILMGK